MNQHLEKAVFDCNKVDALMYAYEAAFLCDANDGTDTEMKNRAEHAFYAIWDAIHTVQNDLEDMTCTQNANG